LGDFSRGCGARPEYAIARGEIAGGPVDGVVAGEQIGPGDERPAGGKDACDDATLPGPATKPQNQHHEAEHDRQSMPRERSAP
jgi:hypothetical protein